MAAKLNIDKTRLSLQDSIALLMQTQALVNSQIAEIRAEIAEINRRGDRRYAEMQVLFSEIREILHRLPEAVREKIGFKSK